MTKTIKVANVSTSFINSGDTIRFNYHDKPRFGTVEACESTWLLLRDTNDTFKSYSYRKIRNCEYICK